MNFLLQTNIWDEYDYGRFKQSILDAGETLEEVNVIPFTENFTPEPTIKPDYVFGSGRFVNISRFRGYPTFRSFDPIELHYPEHHWVNSGGYDTTWGDLKIDRPMFVKPYREKFFTGRVIESQSDKEKVQLSTSFIEDESLEKVRVSDPVDIIDEIRVFVLGGEIVTASYYKINRRPNHQQIKDLSPALQWVQSLNRTYGPIDRAFVIDIGRTNTPDGLHPDGWKIVELNNFNSSGLYKADTDALVRAMQIL